MSSAPSRGRALFSLSSVKDLLARSKARATIWRPSAAYCARTASRVARRIAERALPVMTKPSHTAGGVWPSARAISTSSPFCSSDNKRRVAAIDLRADRRVADIGMDRIGEIDRRRAARQGDQPAVRREAEHLVMKEFELRMLEEFLGRVALARAGRSCGAAIDRRGSRAPAPRGRRRARPCRAHARRCRCGRYHASPRCDLSSTRCRPGPTTVVWID